MRVWENQGSGDLNDILIMRMLTFILPIDQCSQTVQVRTVFGSLCGCLFGTCDEAVTHESTYPPALQNLVPTTRIGFALRYTKSEREPSNCGVSRAHLLGIGTLTYGLDMY